MRKFNIMYSVTIHTAVCPAEGQIFKQCISSCQYTCESFGRQIQCSDDCTAGCDCPDELVSFIEAHNWDEN